MVLRRTDLPLLLPCAQVLIGAYTSHLAEAAFDYQRAREEALAASARKATGWQGCDAIATKAECCKWKHEASWLGRGTNCLPGDYGGGVVCKAEASLGSLAHLAVACGAEPTALSARAWSSAWRAVDGAPVVASFQDSSCVHTYERDDPWLQLDLGSAQDITSVTIHNRKDCCGSDNSGLDVYLDSRLCASGVKLTTGSVSRVPCAGRGRVVKLVNAGAGKSLSVCEVAVNVKQGADVAGRYPRNAGAEALALRHLLKLFAVAPDYHATGAHAARTGDRKRRVAAAAKAALGRRYKAVVVVFLEGGADSFNMVVPHSGCA